MQEAHTLAGYVDELAGLPEADALVLVSAPALVQATEETGTSQRGFHTEYIDRRRGVQASTEPSKREVFWVRKRGDGVFGGHISVGRTQNLDIPIVRAGVSKFHGFFSIDEQGRYRLTDKDSKNGTFVGEERLIPGTAHEVRDGDQVRFGSHAFVFLEPPSFVKLVFEIARTSR
jgi:hypothetical protein